VIVGLFFTTLSDRPASFKAARHLSIYFRRLQPEHKAASYSCNRDPTHCSRDKHFARPHMNKKK
jgi:hypothetical protein